MQKIDTEYMLRILHRSAFNPSSIKSPAVLDLFCGAGGATYGYQLAGYYVVGVDIKRQPHYCGDQFIMADALEWVNIHRAEIPGLFDLIHASPPCQAYSLTKTINHNVPSDYKHEPLVDRVRETLKEIGLPYVMENVKNSPLHNPILLCGAMFPNLRVYRHRLFETSFDIPVPKHPVHFAPQNKIGSRPNGREFISAIGNFSGVKQAREAMGISWMNRDELSQAIPPAYTNYIASHLPAIVSG